MLLHGQVFVMWYHSESKGLSSGKQLRLFWDLICLSYCLIFHSKNAFNEIQSCCPARTVLLLSRLFEPRREKTGLRGFRPGLTQTDLYIHRFKKKRNCAIRVAKKLRR